jgi:hypothetical protein
MLDIPTIMSLKSSTLFVSIPRFAQIVYSTKSYRLICCFLLAIAVAFLSSANRFNVDDRLGVSLDISFSEDESPETELGRACVPSILDWIDYQSNAPCCSATCCLKVHRNGKTEPTLQNIRFLFEISQIL